MLFLKTLNISPLLCRSRPKFLLCSVESSRVDPAYLCCSHYTLYIFKDIRLAAQGFGVC